MPRSPAPTDRGVDTIPDRVTCRFCPFQGAHGLNLRTTKPFTIKMWHFLLYAGVRVFYFLVASVRLIQVQDGISTLGLYGAAFCVLCVPGRIWERHILSNSGVLAWTPVGKQMGTKDTSSSDASLECAS